MRKNGSFYSIEKHCAEYLIEHTISQRLHYPIRLMNFQAHTPKAHLCLRQSRWALEMALPIVTWRFVTRYNYQVCEMI